MKRFLTSNLNHFLKTTLNLSSDNDARQIALWLNEYTNSHYTYIKYRVVVLRFYLWIKHNRLSLKALQRMDVLNYIEFIQNPDITWIGKRKSFNHPGWRPFLQPLSASATLHNFQIIRQLFSYLYNISYLDFDPCKFRLRMPYFLSNSFQNDHCLTYQEINLIGNYISRLPNKTSSQYTYKVRTRWIFQILLFTGCRKSEVSNATMDDFIIIKNKLWLQVNGKGNKYGKIPILTHLEIRLNRYREIYNLPSIRDKTSSESHIPLVIMSKHSEDDYKSVAHDYIWYTVKSICRDLANTISSDNILHSRLRRVSPHWLRHTSATIQIDSGIDIRMVQANLRHSSIKTTLLYLHIENDVRHRETVTKFTSKLII